MRPEAVENKVWKEWEGVTGVSRRIRRDLGGA